MEFKTENFDQEFGLNNNNSNKNKNNKKNNKKNKSPRGKIPPWIMILAGAAVIGGVVAANQPYVRPVENSTQPTLSLAVTEEIRVQADPFNIINDEQADEAELAAHFIAQGDLANAQFIVPVSTNGNALGYDMEMDPLDIDENGTIIRPADEEADASIIWVDGKPYAITIQPRDDIAPEKNAAQSSSYYWLNNQPYEVHLEAVDPSQMNNLTVEQKNNLIRIGEQTYLLQLTPVNENAAKSAQIEPTVDITQKGDAEIIPFDAIIQTSEAVVPDQKIIEKSADDESAVAWLNDKAYAVTVKPYTETESESEKESGNNNGDENETAEETQTTVFSVDGAQYALELSEIDTANLSRENSTQPIVWLEETPLEVLLSTENADDPTGTEDPIDAPIDIQLKPLSQEQTAALQRKRFGEKYAPTAMPASNPEPTAEPTPMPTEVPEESNFIVNIFNNFFGSNPTQAPTPQVTIIPLTPTPTIPLPTATSIVVRLAPTATVQGPIRLDETETVPSDSRTTVSKGNDLEDPALIDNEDESETSVQTPTKSPTKEPTKPVSETTIQNTPTIQPTPEELPQTGMAESWNIPSLLAMLGGLLLVILGVRRLRSNRN